MTGQGAIPGSGTRTGEVMEDAGRIPTDLRQELLALRQRLVHMEAAATQRQQHEERAVKVWQNAYEDLECQIAAHAAALQRVRVHMQEEVLKRRKAEEALRRHQEDYKTIFDSVPARIYYKDAHNRFLRVNQGAAMADGYTVEAMEGRSGWELYPAELASKHYADDLEVIWSGQPKYGIIEQRMNAAGRPRWQRVDKIPYRDRDGNIVGVIAFSLDITEQQQAEALLAGQNHVLEMIATDVPLPDILNEILRTLEKQAPHMLASLLLLDADAQRLHHGAAPSLEAAYVQALDGMAIAPQAASAGTAAYRRETVIVADIMHDPLWDPYRELAQRFQLRACWSTPIFATNGAVLGVFAMYYREPREPDDDDRRLVNDFTHITGIAIEHKRAESALRASEERFRNLIEGSLQGVLIHRQGQPLFANRAWADIFGYSSPDAVLALGSLTPFFPPSEHERLRSYTAASLRRSDLPMQFEGQGMRSDGTVIWLNNLVKVVDWMGEPAVQFTVLDITDQRRLADQLRQAYKMEALGTLAGGIAHDFNNILTAMIGYADLAIYDLEQTHPAYVNLQEVLIAGKRAKALVQQILTFSRRNEQEPQPIQLIHLVQEILTLLRASLPATIEMRQDLDPDTGTVLADQTQMHQVILNLCTNSEHAMRERGGILEVCLHNVDIDPTFAAQYPELHPGPYVCLIVRDTGHGMSADLVARIFDPFFTTKKAQEGTGMGLAVVHGIVTGHGGAITVQSAPEVGTTFVIYLPRSEESEVEQLSARMVIPRGTGCILFVDDEPSVARLGQKMLALFGYEVVVCASGTEALEIFQEAPHRFDLVITDQTMPHMTGEHLSSALRKIRADIPIILCTGFSYTMDAEKARALGIDAFLFKPLVIRDLGMAVQQVLTRRLASDAC